MDLFEVGKIKFSIESKNSNRINFEAQIKKLEDLFGSLKINDPHFSYKTSFEKILAKIAINKNLTINDIKQLSDNEINQCSNEIFRRAKWHLINGQKLLDKFFDESRKSVSIQELFTLFKDMKLANKIETRELFKHISSQQTLSIADQLDNLTSNISSVSKDPELSYIPSMPLDPTLPLKKIEKVLQKQNELLMSSQNDADTTHKTGLIWNKRFFCISIVTLFVSIVVGGIQIYLAFDGSKETDQRLSNRQESISTQNELLSKILESQEATSRQVNSAMSKSSANESKEVLNTLKSIESLLIKNNSLLTQTTKDIKTDELEINVKQ